MKQEKKDDENQIQQTQETLRPRKSSFLSQTFTPSESVKRAGAFVFIVIFTFDVLCLCV